jgi:hypothetical protein
MLVKTVLVFLLGMLLVGMIGRALFPGALGRVARRTLTSRKPGTCKRCGSYVIGTGPCPCGSSKRKT